MNSGIILTKPGRQALRERLWNCLLAELPPDERERVQVDESEKLAFAVTVELRALEMESQLRGSESGEVIESP